MDANGVRERFGVPPASIPDYLALVGDSSDGYPGLPGFGARTAAALLARWLHLEGIPADAEKWQVPVRGAERLARTLAEQREEALLYRRLATLVRDVPGIGRPDDWRWRGPRPEFAAVAQRLEMPALAARAERLQARALARARSEPQASEDQN
jgi:5'-3' exonuclease